jgi:hypothetical protein
VRRLDFTVTIGIILILSAPGAVSAGGSSGRMPPRISSADGPDSEPAWLSAEPGVDPHEKLTQDALPPRVKSVIEQELREGADKRYGCVYYGPVSVDRAGPIPPYATLKDLARNSRAAIRGTITDIDHGFSFIGPSSLVEIRVDEWLKKSKSDRIADQPFVYLIYPVAEFEAGGHRFCKVDPLRWGSEPQIGDELLVFPYSVAIDEARQLFFPDPDGYEVILYRKGKGSFSLPKSLRNDPDVVGVKDIATLKRRALEYIEKTSGPGSAGVGEPPLPR